MFSTHGTCYETHQQIGERLWNELRNSRQDWVSAPPGSGKSARDRLTIALALFHGFVSQAKRSDEPSGPILVNVTPRELEVLERIAQGLTTKQIARELKVTFKTAATHRTHLLDKLDANNVALLVRRAIARGLIQP